MSEVAVQFGDGNSLIGVVTEPAHVSLAVDRPAVLLLNAGGIHRSGPHRLYVKIARSLTAAGFIVLRFDFSGIGDSQGRTEYISPRKGFTLDTLQAMDYLQRTRKVNHFILLGICYGGVIAYETALCEQRVIGTILINPQGFTFYAGYNLTDYQSRLAGYYSSRFVVFPAASWRRVTRFITGQTEYRRVFKTLAITLVRLFVPTRGMKPEVVRIREGFKLLAERGVNLLLIYSNRDPGMVELKVIFGSRFRQLYRDRNFGLIVVKKADHLFTLLKNQDLVVTQVLQWVKAAWTKDGPMEESESREMLGIMLPQASPQPPDPIW